MCIGAGLSPMFKLEIAMLVLAGYLVLSIYTYIGTILKGEFLLTYGSFGPTELRLIIIAINTLFMYTSWPRLSYTVCNLSLTVFDFVGLFIATFLFVAWLVQFLKDRKILSERDPLKPFNPEK